MPFADILRATKQTKYSYILLHSQLRPNCRRSKFSLFNYILNKSDLFFDKEKAINEFCGAQKVYHTLTKYIRIKKANNMNIVRDLSFAELDLYKNHIKIDIIHNGCLYQFLLRDIHNIWKNSLLYNNLMVSEPAVPKNPYNNIYFTNTHLYNIYFKMLFTGMTIHNLIHAHVRNKLDMYLFSSINANMLIENAVIQYIDGIADSYRNYNIISSIKADYPSRTYNIYFIRNDFSNRLKNICIKKLHNVIKYYLLLSVTKELATISHKYDIYKLKLYKELRKINEYIFCRPYLRVQKANNKRKINKYYYFGEDETLLFEE